MSAILSPPRPSTLPPIPRTEETTGLESHASVSQVTQMLCGGGLILWGLLRGSWLGLTLAATGGLLLYRGLTPSSAPIRRRQHSSHDDAQTGAGRERSPTVLPPPIGREANMGEDIAERAESSHASPSAPPLEMARSLELTPEEHGEAEAAAYYHALERGGGWLPPYEHAKAVEDFCWAAGRVLRQRP